MLVLYRQRGNNCYKECIPYALFMLGIFHYAVRLTIPSYALCVFKKRKLGSKIKEGDLAWFGSFLMHAVKHNIFFPFSFLCLIFHTAFNIWYQHSSRAFPLSLFVSHLYYFPRYLRRELITFYQQPPSCHSICCLEFGLQSGFITSSRRTGKYAFILFSLLQKRSVCTGNTQQLGGF